MTVNADVLADIRAVLIGVSAYEYADLPPIRAARNSLEAMHALLTDPALCGWPSENITVIANPVSASELALQIADLAEAATRVLLLYYVGHGLLSARGELCLTVTSTRPDRPKISGLVWDTVADVLRTCPATARLAILDCCFAGQAIEALASDGAPALADITHVDGVYTLTATTRNRTAHVPPPGQQDTACTSFTGELKDLIRSGIPGGPPRLNLGDIYPVLHQRLLAKGLPAPSQRVTSTIHQFPFTANAAHARYEGNGAHETTNVVPAPLQTARSRATRLLEEAIRVAHLIANEGQRAQVLAEVALVVGASDPNRAARLLADAERVAQSITDHFWLPRKDQVLADVARIIAVADPYRAGRLAKAISTDDERARALVDIALVAASFDPEQAARLLADAEHVAQAIPSNDQRARVLVDMALMVATLEPERATRLFADAEQAAQQVSNKRQKTTARRQRSTDQDPLEQKARVLADIAKAVAASDPDWAARLSADAERAAQSVDKRQRSQKAQVLADIAMALAASDPDRAESIARSIIFVHQRELTLAHIARVVAPADPDRAERLANSIATEHEKAPALAGVAIALAASDPGRAERLAYSINNYWGSSNGQRQRERVLAEVAKAVAVSDPDRAERLAQSISRRSMQKARILMDAAKAVAASDPDRATRLLADAERIAQSITDDNKKALAFADLVKVVVLSDPDRAERMAQSITGKEKKARALADVAEAVAALDADRAERVTQSITDAGTRVLALLYIAKIDLQRQEALPARPQV